ncbi:hypothetical protein L7F22_007338 [Adiantum nelumboides]|nr:hypothetical protein [Adiantum nelumboides]
MLMEEKPELLMNLCAADLEGYGDSPHISWLPNLRHSKYSRFEANISVVHECEVVTRRSAEVLMLKDNGSLVMQVAIVHASLSRDGYTLNRDYPSHLDFE